MAYPSLDASAMLLMYGHKRGGHYHCSVTSRMNGAGYFYLTWIKGTGRVGDTIAKKAQKRAGLGP